MSRVLIAVTHLLGVGHFTRAAALARAFAQTGHATTLVSGGLPAPLVPTGGVDLVQLPPVRITGAAFTTLLGETGAPAGADRLEARRAALLRLVEAARPQIVITELFPFGRRVLAGEFLALIEASERLVPRPLIVASVRDILVAPEKPGRVAESHARLARHYDAVLVHGDPDLVALDRSWPLDDRVRPLLRYTGYVDEAPPPPGGPAHDDIIVSGGGSAASLPLYRAAIEAARAISDRPWRILVGGGVEQGAFDGLLWTAPPHVTVERARADFRTLVSGAALSISQAGYNTAVDLLRTGVRAVLVPFEGGRETEQRLRADCLAAAGVAEIVTEAELSPMSLAAAARAALARARPERLPVRLDGAERTVAIVEEMLRRRGGRRSITIGQRPTTWRPLDDALVRTADQGRAIKLWWRDDDAVAATPALERLLALAGRLDLPLALAAIPAAIDASLVDRFAAAPAAAILVHGLRHQSHAPANRKKAEFGPHRSVEKLRCDAEDALRVAREKLDGRVLPVFVPPWNRITPDLVAALPGLGYRGLSTFRPRALPRPAPGLVQVNAHLDPIDWRGSRGLIGPDRLVAALANLLDARSAGRADAAEPLGLLTHHLIHDEAVWAFCEALLERLLGHACVRGVGPGDVFSCQGDLTP